MLRIALRRFALWKLASFKLDLRKSVPTKKLSVRGAFEDADSHMSSCDDSTCSETHVHVAEGAFHVFDMIAPNTSVSQRFFASQCRAVRWALVNSPPYLH